MTAANKHLVLTCYITNIPYDDNGLTEEKKYRNISHMQMLFEYPVIK